MRKGARSTRPLLLAVVVVGWMGSFPVWAEYQSKGKRDPFVPLVTSEGKRIIPPGTDEETAVGLSGLTLQGIVFDPTSSSYAVINGRVVREKDALGGATILRIEPHRVLVLLEDKQHELHLPKAAYSRQTKGAGQSQGELPAQGPGPEGATSPEGGAPWEEFGGQ